MITCRPVTSGEADAYLNLLCEVFELDSSRAGQIFYSEPFFDLGRKWALFDGKRLVSILSLTPLVFGWGKGVGIAGVATHPSARGRGHGQRLLESALEGCAAQGEKAAYLFAYKPTLYARAGFQVIDEVISGDIRCSADPGEMEPMSHDTVKDLYTDWSAKDPRRLIRDDQRWRAWQWVYRPCEAFAGGYLCTEPMLCREALVAGGSESWPLMPGSRWVGLRTMAESIGVPLLNSKHELLLMARGAPSVPQMFMTDQF